MHFQAGLLRIACKILLGTAQVGWAVKNEPEGAVVAKRENSIGLVDIALAQRAFAVKEV